MGVAEDDHVALGRVRVGAVGLEGSAAAVGAGSEDDEGAVGKLRWLVMDYHGEKGTDLFAERGNDVPCRFGKVLVVRCCV